MLKEPYQSSRPVDATNDPFAFASEPLDSVSRREEMNAVLKGMAGSAGAIVLGLVWLAVGYHFGYIYFYPFFLIGGGFLGLFTSVVGLLRIN